MALETGGRLDLGAGGAGLGSARADRLRRGAPRVAWVPALQLARPPSSSLVFLLGPIAVCCVSSFWTIEGYALVAAETWANCREALTDPISRGLIAQAVATAFLAAAIIVVSLFSGSLVRIDAWRTVLGDEGVINVRLMRLDRSFEEAARDLGATALRSFRLIVLPLLAPALPGAVLVVVAWSLDDLVIAFFTGGVASPPPVLVRGMVRRSIDPSVDAVAGAILVTTIASTLLTGRFVGGREIAR